VVNTVSLAIPKLKNRQVTKNHLTLDTTAIASVRIDWKDFYIYTMRKIKYPVQAQQSDFQGNSYIKFTISNGEIEGLGVAGKSLGHGCDAEVMSTILSYKDFKSSADGKYILPVSFRIEGIQTPVQNEKVVSLTDYKTLSTIYVSGYSKSPSTSDNGSASAPENDSDTKVYSFVAIETQPGYPGGMIKFYEYLRSNLKYPAEAAENKVQGKVYLSFTVEKDGSLTGIKVDRKLGSGTDEEAVRVMQASPKWTPGIQGGKPVRVKYNIPISFNLTNDNHPTSQTNTGNGIHGGIIIRKGTNNSLMNISSNSGPNAPLFVVDGKKLTNSEEMTFLKPDDIETIYVLKGESSTALYGEEGKNGVVIVSTKKANKDSKATHESSTTTIKKNN